jgi:hypothetical protein
MGESVRQFGVDNKKRFTIKYPDGTVFRTGTCDPKEDERHDIIAQPQKRDGANGTETYLQYVLTQYQKDDFDYSQPEKQRTLVPEGALVANGYYNHEWDDFVSPENWIKQK